MFLSSFHIRLFCAFVSSLLLDLYLRFILVRFLLQSLLLLMLPLPVCVLLLLTLPASVLLLLLLLITLLIAVRGGAAVVFLLLLHFLGLLPRGPLLLPVLRPGAGGVLLDDELVNLAPSTVWFRIRGSGCPQRQAAHNKSSATVFVN